MKETDLMHLIQTELCRDPRVRLFRNNVGNGWVGVDQTRPEQRAAGLTVLANARRIQFGLGPGTSDLIGGVSLIVTPSMLGKRIFQFSAPEVKISLRTATNEQRAFISTVNSLGGRAGFVRSVEEAQELLR